VLEETGLTVKNIHIDGVVNAVWTTAEHHFVNVLVRADVDDDYLLEPITAEPHKCQGIFFAGSFSHDIRVI
jgi:hypothetical protein